MKPSKKNKFFTFCFSFIPGAGEMYMGFMKMGLSIMGLFLALCVLSGFLSVVFFVAVLVWFFSFFHVHHLSSRSDEEFAQVEDGYIFFIEELLEREKISAGKYRKWVAYLLIGLGVMMLWNTGTFLIGEVIDFFPEPVRRALFYIIGTVPPLVIALLVIICGIKMIRGKKRTLYDQNEHQDGQPQIPSRD
jgi:hypothetical protein